MLKVLIVEDEKKVLQLLKKGLTEEGMEVMGFLNLPEALESEFLKSCSVIVLDRLLKGVDSLDQISQIKQSAPQAPILILSALSEVEEKVEGLSVGADDYLGKPFHIKELAARITALSRRKPPTDTETAATLSYEDLVVQLETQRVMRGDKKIDLTAKEYKLLAYLLKNPGKTFSKNELIKEVWELNYFPESNIVEVAINHLRNKIDKDFSLPLIHSRRGVGYWLGHDQ